MSIRPKIRTKETDKQKHREFSKSEEEKLSSTLAKYSTDVSSFEGLTAQIERNIRSRETTSLDSLNGKIAKLREKLDERRSRLKDIEPELERVSRSINDQERHKKLLQENIGLFQARQRISDLQKEISRYQEDLEQVEGYASCDEDFSKATARKRSLEETKARHEGRRGGFIDQIRTLKVRITSVGIVRKFRLSLTCVSLPAKIEDTGVQANR